MLHFNGAVRNGLKLISILRMKKLFYLAICIIVPLTACKKNTIASDNGCISRITRHYADAADSTAATNLLKQNNISLNNLVYLRVILNDTITNAAGVTSINQSIFALEYFNGLPLFSAELGLFFKNDVFQSLVGPRYTSIGLNTRPLLTLPEVRKLYVDDAAKHPDPTAVNVKDSCLVAEFGYYDLNAGTGNPAPYFVKAWSVTPKNSNYPLGIFRDDSGKTIVYTSGIEAFIN